MFRVVAVLVLCGAVGGAWCSEPGGAPEQVNEPAAEPGCPFDSYLIPGIGGVSRPQLTEHGTEAVYPEAARTAAREGTVILQCVIDTSGRVREIDVLREEPVDWGFARAAAHAVREWRYEPATRDGKPVCVYLTVHVAFTPESGGKARRRRDTAGARRERAIEHDG